MKKSALKRFFVYFTLSTSIFGLTGCGGSDPGSPPPPHVNNGPIVNPNSIPNQNQNLNALVGRWKSTKIDTFSLGTTGYLTLQFTYNQITAQEICKNSMSTSNFQATVSAPFVYVAANKFQINTAAYFNFNGCSVSLLPVTATFALTNNNTLTLTMPTTLGGTPVTTTFTRIP